MSNSARKHASNPDKATASHRKPLTGTALLKDMHAYGKKVSATRESARDFLTQLGVLDRNGKQRTLIRG